MIDPLAIISLCKHIPSLLPSFHYQCLKEVEPISKAMLMAQQILTEAVGKNEN
jgi:hypothetical protein